MRSHLRDAPIPASEANLSKGSDAKPPVCGIDLIHLIAGLPAVMRRVLSSIPNIDLQPLAAKVEHIEVQT